MSTPASFYVVEPAGATDPVAFRATEATRGPWSDLHQHGGPPAGLLAQAMEREVDPAAMRVARFSISFLRPIPIDVFRVAVETARDGKKVKVLRARLLDAQGRDVAIAEALFVRRADVGVAPTLGAALRPVEECDPFVFPFFGAPVGYHTAMEGRHAGGAFGTGAMALWMRMRVPVLPGVAPTPLVRVVVAADSGNGISLALDIAEYTSIPPELTVVLARELEGEWVGLDARTTLGRDGIGLADAALCDGLGAVGRGLQPLVLDRRPKG